MRGSLADYGVARDPEPRQPSSAPQLTGEGGEHLQLVTAPTPNPRAQLTAGSWGSGRSEQISTPRCPGWSKSVTYSHVHATQWRGLGAVDLQAERIEMRATAP